MTRQDHDQRDSILRCPPPPVGCGQEVMIYNKRFDMWECPRCGSEFWREGSKLRPLNPIERADIHDPGRDRPIDFHTGKPVLSYGYVPLITTKKRGGKRSSKRRKKKPSGRRRWADEGVLRP